MILSWFASTCALHHSKVSRVTAPAGYPPLSPRPTGGPPSLRSPMARKRMFPTWKEYRSQVPSTGQGLRWA